MSERTTLTKEDLGDFLLELLSRMELFDNHPTVKPVDINFGVLPQEKEEMKKNATALMQHLTTLRDYAQDNPSDGLSVVLRQLEDRVAIIEKKHLLEL